MNDSPHAESSAKTNFNAFISKYTIFVILLVLVTILSLASPMFLTR